MMTGVEEKRVFKSECMLKL